MKSRRKPSRRLYKAALALALIGLFLQPPSAEAFLGFLRRKPTTATQHPLDIPLPEPNATQPLHRNLVSPTVPAASHTDQAAASESLSLPAPTSSHPDVQLLVEHGIFPADAPTRQTPLTRAELADILVRALGHNRNLYSEFPFYRDVPRSHWAYVPIDIARSKRLIEQPDGQGYYQPDDVVTFAEAYQAMANAVPGAPPSEEMTAYLLHPFEGWEHWPEHLQQAVAKLARARFFPDSSPLETPVQLPTDAPLQLDGLAPLVRYLVQVTDYRKPLVTLDRRKEVPALPSGLTLAVTPMITIYAARITVGQTVHFSLVTPAQNLPKGSRLRGIVRDIPSERQYIIELNEAQTPQDEIFQTRAELVLTFDASDRLAFIVPGDIFTTVTQPVPELGEPPVVSP